MDWLDDLAEVLDQEPLSDEERTLLLDLARDIAHGTERRFAPLSALMIGRALGASEHVRTTRLRVLVDQVRAALPDPT